MIGARHLEPPPVKLNCPICSALLELNDALAKKLVRCPKCEQSFVVPQVPPPLVAQKPNLKIEQPPDEYDLGVSPVEAAAAVGAGAVDPATLKFCPGCGAPWKKGAIECNKCNFIPALGAHLKPKQKEKRDLRVNMQNVYLVIFVVAIGTGGYWLFTHWNSVRASINSFFPTN